MNLKKAVVLWGLVIVMAATAQIVFAQEAAVTPADSTVVASNQQPASEEEGDMQWAWGEITNLDNQAKTVTLKYLDYETDQEKELVLAVDEKTTFENINDFNELKLEDTLSIDYILGADNKNIAKNISFEKSDTSSSVLAPEVNNSEPVTDAAQPAVPVKTAVPDLAPPTASLEIPVSLSSVANEAGALEPAPAPAEPEPAPAV